MDAPAYRLPDATRVRGVQLQVSDMNRSLAFYRDLLGFRVLQQSPERVALGPHGEDVRLIELRENRSGTRPSGARRLGLYHFAVLLPDRAALGRILAHLRDAGVRLGMADHAVSEALYLNDPDGLGLEIYSDRPPNEWTRNANELVMTTEPLDVASVLRAGGEVPWQGMPPGTTVGHVHLHVGDLERANDFYHRALGLDATVWSYPGALFMAAGGYHHHLGTNVWAGSSASAAHVDEPQLLEWELLVPAQEDADAVARSMEQAGFSVAASDGVRRVVDPWGTPLGIYWTTIVPDIEEP